MKKPLLLFIFFLLFIFNVKGQNLVPNGDFEGYSGCPSNISQLDSSLFWINPTIATPDYFNQCDTGFTVDIPSNAFGFQNTHSGAAYSGIYFF